MAPLFGRQGALHPAGGASQVLQSGSGDPPAAFLQGRVVARSLRPDQPAEPERPARDRELLPRVVHDLEEEPGRRAALVQLARRVQVTRTEAVRDDAAGLLA